MSEQVVIFVADAAYLSHVKAAMVGCVRQGSWRGDFCLVVPQALDVSDFVRRGIRVLPVPDSGFAAKFWIFSDFFCQWSACLYLDCDILVQGRLSLVFDQLTQNTATIIAGLEDVSSVQSWQVWDREHEQHREVYAQIESEFPWVYERMFNTSAILFTPQAIETETVQRLRVLQERFAVANPIGYGGTDQQIINLLLHNQMIEVRDKLFCYWGSDEPQSRVLSGYRGWTGQEVPVVLHYTRWYAPWVPKEPGADAYEIRRLSRVCHELYAENLAAFHQEFPYV